MSNEIWVLGATGRTGQAIARRLHERGAEVVLCGRDRGRLDRVAAGMPGVRTRTDVTIAGSGPGVVVNTVGPFGRTAAGVARSCPPGTHYLDVANELPAAQAILDLDRHAVAAGQTLVTGAGFGVLATESALRHLLEDQETPARVRVDALASVATEAGAVGEALAATIVEVLTTGGRVVRGGRLVRSRTAGHPERFTTPDGDAVATASGPSGELLAAWRASGAAEVVAASSLVPAGAAARLAIPALAAILRIPGATGFATRRLAGVTAKARDRPRVHSWARARAGWPGGETRTSWLRAGDAMDFTAGAAAEVAYRLLKGEGRPGAYTPGLLFGWELAEAAGGTLISV
jgi:short subunit dehydrogenase-like uncharacterized protein